MSRDRRISGSASFRRLVACSRVAKLFKSLARAGCCPRRRRPRRSPAHAASAARLPRPGKCPVAAWPSCSNCRHRRVLLAEDGLVDLQRSPHQRLGFLAPVGGCSRVAKLFKSIATVGCCLPKAATSISSARRISGSASSSRLVSNSRHRQVPQTNRYGGVSVAEGGLVDLQRSPHQRLGVPEPIGVQ